MQKYGLPIAIRLEKHKTIENGPLSTPCWIWGLAKVSGYGVMTTGGRTANRKSEKCHRLAWIEYKGPIPDGKFVCHKCDVRACFNPEHLFLGSHAENIRDAARKGRMSRTNGFHANPPRGESNRGAVMTEPQVLSIRAEFAAGATTRQLEAKYGITFSAVRRIVKRQTWTHI